MKNYFFGFSYFIFFIILCACSSDDDTTSNVEDEDPIVATSLLIEGSTEELEIGEEISFIVTDNLGEDRTQEAVININENPIDGNVFTTIQKGTFTATASVEELESDTFTFTVNPEPTNFREHQFEQTLVIYQGYVNDEIEGLSVDGYLYIILGHNGQNVLENQNTIQESDDSVGFIMVTQEDEFGVPYLPGESVETEELLNNFLLKEDGEDEEELIDFFEEGNYNVNIGNVVITSETSGIGQYQLSLVFSETESYTAEFEGNFIFFDFSNIGGGNDPEERNLKTLINSQTIKELKSRLNQ